MQGGTATYLSQLYDFTTLGVTDQNALQEYLEMIAGSDVANNVAMFKSEYMVQQSIAGGRISAVPEPTTFGLIGVAALTLARRRRAWPKPSDDRRSRRRRSSRAS